MDPALPARQHHGTAIHMVDTRHLARTACQSMFGGFAGMIEGATVLVALYNSAADGRGVLSFAVSFVAVGTVGVFFNVHPNILLGHFQLKRNKTQNISNESFKIRRDTHRLCILKTNIYIYIYTLII